MRKHAALLLTVLLLATACSKGGKSGTDVPVAVPHTPVAIPERPPAKVEVPPDNVISRLAIAALAATPAGGAGFTGTPVTAKDDAGWMNAKADLVKRLEQSPNTPDPGLQEALLVYYRRPDVAALPATVADPVHAVRITQYVGTKEGPSPNAPVVIKVNPLYDGAPAWSLSLVQWKSGERVQTAPLTERNVMTARSVSYQGRPAILVFQFATPTSPLSLSAYTLGDNQLEPISLTVPPAVMGVTPTVIGAHQLEFRGGQASIRHPDFYWACFGESCLDIDWSDANGLTLKPTGFGSAEASKRLQGTDGNRMPVSNVDLGAYIDVRLADRATLEEAPGALSQRLGAKVATARSGDAVARAISFAEQSWLGGKGYQHSFGRIQFRGAGVTYDTLPFGGGGYIDHRVLQEGNKVYLLLLTETEPRPTGDTILDLYVAEGGKVQVVELPESLKRGPKRFFASMDARLLLSCPASAATTLSECNWIRLEGGELVTLKAGALGGEPAAEARQAREKALAKFQAGAFAEAAQLFRQATELAPLWVDAWNDLSLAYQKAGDWPSALTAAHTALRLKEQSAAGYYHVGVSYLGLGDPESALAYLDLAAKQQPNSVEVWLALARARQQAHLRITAVMAYDQVLELEPGNAEAAAGVQRVRALLPPK